MHYDYHTCDRCGKRLSGGQHGWCRTISVHWPYSTSWQDIKALKKRLEQTEKEIDGSVDVAFEAGVFRRADKYELCSSCAKKARKLIKQFMKDND